MLTRILSWIIRSRIRGSWRLTDALADRFPSLQDVRVPVEGGIFHADLRIGSARAVLAEPVSTTGEEKVMREFVRPGDVVFDIGAHLGFYSLLLAKLAGSDGKLISFEPNPELLPSLRKTLGAKSNVELFDCALSDAEGVMKLYVPEDASMASLSNWTEGTAGDVKTQECEIHVLDKLVRENAIPMPSFVKCDVEGAEISVFRGAREILDREEAPVLLFELNLKAASSFGYAPADYAEFFASLGNAEYSFFDVRPEGLRPMHDWQTNFTNVLAVPVARSDSGIPSSAVPTI